MKWYKTYFVILILYLPGTTYGYGPFDYTNPEHVRDKLPIVEQYHFSADVEALRDTMHNGSGTIGAHLWYVIRSFPNHHRALNSMAELWRRNRKEGKVPDSRSSFDARIFI